MEGGEGETLALVLAKELALVQADVVHLISRAAAVGAVPLVGRASSAFPDGRCQMGED